MLQVASTALALVAIALVAYGCGGSSKSSTSTTAGTVANATTASTTSPSTSASTTPTVTQTFKVATGKPLSRSAWIVKGDAICAHVNRQVGAYTVRTTAEFTTALPQVALYYNNEAKDLSKLVPPASMTSDGTKIVEGLQLLSAYLSKAGQQFAAGSPDVGGATFQAALKVQKQPIAIARRDGFTQCIKAN